MSKISVGQMSSVSGDCAKNLDKIEKLVKQSVSQEAKMIVLPEMAVCGYRMDECFFDFSQPLTGSLVGDLIRIAKENKIWIYTTIPERNENGHLPYNTGVLVSPGGVKGSYRKVHLWQNEERYFSPGTDYEIRDTPLGKAALMVCFDISFPEAARIGALRGADILLYSMAFAPRDRQYALNLFAGTRALENGCYTVVSNFIGKEKETEFFGGSQIIAPDGQILASLGQEEGIACTEIDIGKLEKVRNLYPYLSCRNIKLDEQLK